MKALLLLLLITISHASFATIYRVGNNKSYPAPNSLFLANVLQNGDTIDIDGGDYRGDATLAVWTPDSLLIRGVNGRPHLIADGKYIHQKGIWVIKGNNCIVENIEFSGASVPDKNGAGIRLDGTGITIRQCYFHDCEDGILTSNPEAGDVLIEYCEFAHCGYGNGYSHNLYIGRINSFTFRFNYTHHCKVGHCIKSRAKQNFICYNFIADETDGYSSRLLDLPNGGFTIVMGNVFMQGVNAINGNIFGYGLEGLSNEAKHELYVVNNTFVNHRHSARFISVKEGTEVVNISNNLFAGAGILLEGTSSSLSNNLTNSDIESFDFVNPIEFDYHLTEQAAAINSGKMMSKANEYSLTPEYEYVHPLQSKVKYINQAIDAGAFEYDMPQNIPTSAITGIHVMPNPAQRRIEVQGIIPGSKIEIFGITGKKYRQATSDQSKLEMNVSSLPQGIYVVKTSSGSIRFIKK